MGLLNKSLYGLRDAPLIWKRHLIATLGKSQFSESPTMPGVLRHEERDIKISVHVDDLLITGTPQDLDWTKDILSNVHRMKFQSVGSDGDLEVA